MSAADILHVRQGKNYLVTDFARTERLREDPTVMSILSRVSREIGFDFVRDYEQVGDRYHLLPNVPFAEWDNPYFDAATPGSIAARYHYLLRLLYPAPPNKSLRQKQIGAVVEYLLKERTAACRDLIRAATQLAADLSENADAQKVASALIREVTHYEGTGREHTPQEKAGRKRSHER